jgi:hypothetical protein
MFELMKIVGVSAVLSAGLVTASEIQPQAAAEATGSKLYTERLGEGHAAPAMFSKVTYEPGRTEAATAQTSAEGKGDRLAPAPRSTCASQAWPHVAPECISGPEGSRRPGVRFITTEHRQGVNTSVLVRIPVSDMAQR